MSSSLIIILVGALSAVISALVGVIAFTLGVNKGVDGKIGGVTKKIDDEIQSVSNKIGGIYKRIDNERESVNKVFVRREICGLMHEGVSEDLKEIKFRVRELEEIKADIKTLLSNNGKGGR